MNAYRRWLRVGLLVSAIAAAVGSFLALMTLAGQTGWPHYEVLGRAIPSGWLLPLSVDVLAVTSGGVWLSGDRVPHAARVYARAVCLTTIAASVMGNALSHLITEQIIVATVLVVVVVGAVPAAALAATAHLFALTVRLPDDDTDGEAAPDTELPDERQDEQPDTKPDDEQPDTKPDRRRRRQRQTARTGKSQTRPTVADKVEAELHQGPATVPELVSRTGAKRTAVDYALANPLASKVARQDIPGRGVVWRLADGNGTARTATVPTVDYPPVVPPPTEVPTASLEPTS